MVLVGQHPVVRRYAPWPMVLVCARWFIALATR